MTLAKHILLLITMLPMPVLADIGFKFITDKGYVEFAAGNDWPVLTMQSKLPISLAVFQLPNPADEGSAHSTNLIFKFYSDGSTQATQSLAEVGKQYGPSTPKQEQIGTWTIYRQTAQQDGMTYTILDAKTKLDSVSSSVRLAWPHLANNPKDYDQLMEKTFKSAMKSVSEHLGSYTPNKNETTRRPTQ